MDDQLQGQRLEYIIDDCDIAISGTEKIGDVLDSNNKVHGLLALVKNNQMTDSRRSYQCIKTLVNATNKSLAVKEKLLQDPEKWQWAVNWLKNKMSTTISTTNSDVSSAVENSNYWTTTGSDGLGCTSDVLSNEDATSTRTFHRTTSAQVILEEANALLAEFGGDSSSMNDNDNSVLMSSLVSQDKSSLQPQAQQQYDASSPSFNRQLAVVPDIDPETAGTLSLDQMDTDSVETEDPSSGQKVEEDSEMPDLINDEVKVSAGTKNKIRTPRQNKGIGKSGGGILVLDKAQKTQDWDFDAVD